MSRNIKDPLAESITISIVSHGHGPLLHRLLSDLRSCNGMRGVPIIVTLNVDEECQEDAYTDLNLRVQRNSRPKGFGANHNQAFEHCRTPWFFILNPDLRLPEQTCFETLHEAVSGHGEWALVAPVITNSAGVPEDAVRFNLSLLSLVSRALGKAKRRPDTRRHAQRRAPFYWLAGMFLMVRSTVFRKLNGFDERYFLYCEDFDLSARIYNSGWTIVQVPGVRVVHDAQRDSHRSLRYLSLHLRSLAKVWTSGAFWRVLASGGS